MNRNHLLPAAVALAVHVFVLFGFAPPIKAPAQPAKEEPPALIARIVPPPVDEPPEFEATVGPPAPRDATPVPGLPEPTPIGRLAEITITVPSNPPVPPGPGLPKVPTNIGVPNPVRGDGNGPGTRIFSPDALDNSPRATFQPAPAYPFEQKRLGISGTVTVTFTVDTEGRVHNAYVVESDPAGFDEAALRAVSRWRFEAGRKNGRTVPFRMTVPILFTIQDES